MFLQAIPSLKSVGGVYPHARGIYAIVFNYSWWKRVVIVTEFDIHF